VDKVYEFKKAFKKWLKVARADWKEGRWPTLPKIERRWWFFWKRR
jgi:hypothetical protein